MERKRKGWVWVVYSGVHDIALFKNKRDAMKAYEEKFLLTTKARIGTMPIRVKYNSIAKSIKQIEG